MILVKQYGVGKILWNKFYVKNTEKIKLYKMLETKNIVPYSTETKEIELH